MLSRFFLPCLTVPIFSSSLLADVREPPASRFLTRSEAMEVLLPNDSFTDVEIGDDQISAYETNCAIGTIPSELTGFDDSNIYHRGPIGPNLSRHCDGGSNETSGVALGGGFNSLQLFRLVSLPNAGRERTADQSEEKPASRGKLTFPGATQFLNDDVFQGFELIDGDWSLFADGYLIDTTYKANTYAPRMELEGYGVSLNMVRRFSNRQFFGFNLTYSNLSGDIDGELDQLAYFENDATNSLPKVTYEDICGIKSGGTSKEETWVIGLFGRTEKLNGWVFDYQASAGRNISQYQSNQCIVSAYVIDDEIINEVFAGTLKGNPETTIFSAEAEVRRLIPVRGVFVSPLLGLTLSHLRAAAYQESETPGNGEFNFPGASLATSEIEPLGTSLAFDASTRISILGQFGAELYVPFRTPAGIGQVSLATRFFQEFGDRQQIRRAHFVEDGREDPLEFTFRGPPVDIFWGDVSATLNLPISSNGLLGLRGSMIFANDYYDSRELGLSLNWVF